MKVASFFAGIGGICYGFKQAGFDIVYANEFDSKACENYKENHPEVKLQEGDIRKIEADSLPDFDVFRGGFPCQPYSLAGKRDGLADVRGTLFFDIVRILKKKEPAALLLENVKNIKSTNEGKDFDVILEHLKDCGYHIKYDVLGGHTHGNVPQCRERMFIAGFRDSLAAEKFDFPAPIPLANTLENIFDRTQKKPDKYYYTPKSQYYKMMDDAMVNKSVYQMRRIYMRENKGGVCPTLTANMGGGGHNVPVIRDEHGIRKLTPAECLRLQGFPEEFKIKTSDVHIYKQAGNAVVVPLIKRIAQNMGKALGVLGT
jgi:DNA (cytosine-5)-methyltransferase 1